MASISKRGSGDCEAQTPECSSIGQRYTVNQDGETAVLCGKYASDVKNGYESLETLTDA